MREHRSYNNVGWVADVQMLTPVDSWRLADQHGLGTVQLRKNARGFTLVDIGTIISLAHLIQEEDRPWLINSQIDLIRFNKVY